MYKILILAVLLTVSANAYSQFFIGLGGAYKEYPYKTYKEEYQTSDGNHVEKELGNELKMQFSGIMPVIMLGYNFYYVRLHFDYYRDSKLKLKYTGNLSGESSDSFDKNITLAEYNFMLDYLAHATDAAKFYFGLGAGTVNFKSVDKGVTTKVNIGTLAEMGFIYSVAKIDLGFGIKSYLTDIKVTDEYSNDLGNYKNSKYTSNLRANTAEAFVAYVF